MDWQEAAPALVAARLVTGGVCVCVCVWFIGADCSSHKHHPSEECVFIQSHGSKRRGPSSTASRSWRRRREDCEGYREERKVVMWQNHALFQEMNKS